MVARRMVQNQDKALIQHESRGRGCQGRALALIRGLQHPVVAFALLTDHRLPSCNPCRGMVAEAVASGGGVRLAHRPPVIEVQPLSGYGEFMTHRNILIEDVSAVRHPLWYIRRMLCRSYFMSALWMRLSVFTMQMPCGRVMVRLPLASATH